MKLLVGLSYYYPHVSGLTLYAQRLAENLARKGHQVTVLTSHHLPTLDCSESHNGVAIIRVPVGLRISKGFLMPKYLSTAWRALREAELVLINLPSGVAESALPILARLRRRPVIAVYHCAIQLPSGWRNRVAQKVVQLGDWIGLSMAHRIVGYTHDYANHTPQLAQRRPKLRIIPPPVTVSQADPSAIEAMRRRYAPTGERLIGFAARLAAEKGVEVALQALRLVKLHGCQAKILFAGEYQNVVGERAYRERMRPLLAEAGDSWEFLGILSNSEMAAFYSACDVLILPSLNRTESFGLVQVESMLCGTPVIASALPGVRVPLKKTAMGRLASVGDSESLATAINEVIQNRQSYVKTREEIEKHFSIGKTLRGYEAVFQELRGDSLKLEESDNEIP